MLFPGVCKCSLGESANVGARACFLRHYKGTTFAATVLTMAGDVVRFLDFIFKKNIIHLTSSIIRLQGSPKCSTIARTWRGVKALLLRL